MKAKKHFIAWLLSALMIMTLLSNQFMMVVQAEESVVSYKDITETIDLGKFEVTGEAKTYSYPILNNYETEEVITNERFGYMYKLDVPDGSVYEVNIEYTGSETSSSVSGIMYSSYSTQDGREFLSDWAFVLDDENNTIRMTIAGEGYLFLDDCDWAAADITLSKIANITSIKNNAIAITGKGTVTGTISENSYIYNSDSLLWSNGFLLKTTLKPGQGYSLEAPSEYRNELQFIVFMEEALGVAPIQYSGWEGKVPVYNSTSKEATYYIWVSFMNLKSGQIPVTVSDIQFVSDMDATPISIDGKATAVKDGTEQVNAVTYFMDEEGNRYSELQTYDGEVYSVELPANSAYTLRYEYTGKTTTGEATFVTALYVFNDENAWMNNLFISDSVAEGYDANWSEFKIVNSENTAKKFYLLPSGTFPEGQVVVTVKPVPEVKVSYRTHIQSIGWEAAANDISKWKSNGAMSGTSGKAKRLEGIEIVVDSANANENVDLGIQYTTHCQSYGWLPWSANGEMNGTEGEAKRLEAIMIKLTGMDAECYDVYYRVHAQSYGWLGWAKNGEAAGTAGYGKRLEGIQIVVVPKGKTFNQKMEGITSARTEAFVAKEGSSPIVNYPATSNKNPEVPGDWKINVAYKTHVQSYGWQGWKYNGQMSGTSGEAKRLEGINIKLTNQHFDGDIIYTTHVQKYGWQGKLEDQSTWKKNGEMSGTSGEAKRLEAICINLTGDMAEFYDIYYRVHAQSYGWLGWVKNGDPAGTAGYAKRLEGIQIVLVPKGEEAPAKNYEGITSVRTEGYISK